MLPLMLSFLGALCLGEIAPREIAPREIAPREIAPREIAPGYVIVVGRNESGFCSDPQEPNASSTCYDKGAPTVGCRNINENCTSSQMKAETLQILSDDVSCIILEWTWVCTSDTLAPCTNLLWCDPIALCHAHNETCSCPGNLTMSLNQTCECPLNYYVFNSSTCQSLTQCESNEYEFSPPTLTSNRICVTHAPTSTPTSVPTFTPTQNPVPAPTSTPTSAPTSAASSSDESAHPVWFWILVVILCIAGTVGVLVIMYVIKECCHLKNRSVAPVLHL